MASNAPKKPRAGDGPRGALPTKSEILSFLDTHPGKAGKREIARAFGIKGGDRVELKRILKEMADEGLLEKRHKGALGKAGTLPNVTVVEVVSRDTDGELIATPLGWKQKEPPPQILIAPGKGTRTPAVGVGDRALVRLTRTDEGYEARVMKMIGVGAQRVLGVYNAVGRDGRVQPVDRKARYEIAVTREDAGSARSGELVLVELERGRGAGLRKGRIVERYTSVDDARSISLIAIHAHGIPFEFPDSVLMEAEGADPTSVQGREDLTRIPFITIDPQDARDHDDAVWAEPDDDSKNKGGWIVYVAIADVAHYVRPGRPLDGEARKRGNSVYFPDRVVPMLPEKLSADLCSLRENETRPVMAVRMIFDADGRRRGHAFTRATIRPVANVTYTEVQAAIDGRPEGATEALLEPVLRPLYGAYEALAAQRDKRSPLDIDLPEKRIVLDEKGHVVSVKERERLDAHRLIEEFMIAANVCAAETLEAKRTPCMYRVHEEPTPEKIAALGEFLQTIGLKAPKGQVLRPRDFNRILDTVADTSEEHVVNEVVLRTQTQAYYSPENFGHFGLALRRYAHFTSPIRRYADLVVHRALIRALSFGKGGLTDEEIASLSDIAEEISGHERRAMAAERDSVDRYLAAFLADRVGATFTGRISGVTRFGLFVSLHETGADGLVPISSLGADYFHHDEAAHALVGERTGTTYRMGDTVDVRLAEATPVTGGLILEVLPADGPDGTQTAKPALRRRRNAGSGGQRGKTSKAGKKGGKAAAKKGKKPKGQQGKRRK